MMIYKKYKPGDTVFLNGNRLTIKSVDPKVYGSQNNYRNRKNATRRNSHRILWINCIRSHDILS